MQQSIDLDQAKQKVIDLFHRAYQTSVAYKDFIDTTGIDPQTIQTAADFEKIPITDKKNYIRKYPVTQRLIDHHHLSDFYMVTSSSGSTGEPSFWPRDLKVDEFLEKKKEELYEQHFQISKHRTLCINTFALGIWTAGMLTSKLSWAAAKNNKFTVISTGTHKENILITIQHLAREYDQIIILGYPPFLLDTINFLLDNGVDVHTLNIKILYTSDSLSDKARQYLLSKISAEVDPKSIVGFYAASDTGIIATQSSLTVSIANSAPAQREKIKQLFGTTDIPALYAFEPQVKFLESIDNEIIISADQPVPLIRYNIHDRGKIINGESLAAQLTQAEFTFDQQQLDNWYVYILGKTDSVLVTANVYIEDIRYCIEHSSYAEKLTDNFKYGAEELDSLKKRLIVKLFLKSDQTLSAEDEERFKEEFTQNLLKINTDLDAVKSHSFVPIRFIFEHDQGNKYDGFKIKYFL